METGTNRTASVRRLHFMAFLLGLWLVAAPFVLHYGRTAATVNSILVGLITAGLSSWRLRTTDIWTSWALIGTGFWIVLSPFIFGYSKAATYWNELAFGIILIVLMLSALGHSIRHHSHLAH